MFIHFARLNQVEAKALSHWRIPGTSIQKVVSSSDRRYETSKKEVYSEIAIFATSGNQDNWYLSLSKNINTAGEMR